MEDVSISVGIIFDSTEEAVENIIMSDDGTGDGILIPGVLITKEAGEKLFNFMEKQTPEEYSQDVLSITFSLPHDDGRVEYDLWYTSSDDRALDFLMDFFEYANGLEDDALYTPRFVFWECINCDKETLDKHCWGNGKYCAVDSTNEKHTGRDIMLEDLREKCINKNEGFKMYWLYMGYVHRVCGGYINTECSI